MRAIFHWEGNLPTCLDLVKILDRGFARPVEQVLRRRGGKPSAPVAFEVSRFDRISVTLLTEVSNELSG